MWTRVAHVSPDFRIRSNTTSQFRRPHPINKSLHFIAGIRHWPRRNSSHPSRYSQSPDRAAFRWLVSRAKKRVRNARKVRLAVPQPAGCPNTQAATFGSRVELIPVFSWFARPSVAYIDGKHPAAAQSAYGRRTKLALAPRALEASNLLKICQRLRKGHLLRLSSVLRCVDDSTHG
jgi:hypothetical protein